MNSATVSGPWVRIRRAKTSSSGVIGHGEAVNERVHRTPRSARDCRPLSCRRQTVLRAQQQDEPDQHEGQREDLSHGEAEGEEAEECIRLAKELRNDAGNAVADEEDAAQRARPLADPGQALQPFYDDEQDDPFKDGLVELAWVARQRAAIRKDHPPGDVGDAAPQFRIDETCDAAPEEANRPRAYNDDAE